MTERITTNIGCATLGELIRRDYPDFEIICGSSPSYVGKGVLIFTFCGLPMVRRSVGSIPTRPLPHRGE